MSVLDREDSIGRVQKQVSESSEANDRLSIIGKDLRKSVNNKGVENSRRIMYGRNGRTDEHSEDESNGTIPNKCAVKIRVTKNGIPKGV